MMKGTGKRNSLKICMSDSSEEQQERQNEQQQDVSPSTAHERVIFERARDLIQPKRFFRLVTLVYAERKLIVFFLAHFIATMVVWSHFALIKYDKQINMVPEGAPRYWWKVLTPSAEFGTMHAILFQMALIPLTMSRYTIAQLATSTGISKFIPLNRMLAIHYHLGYCMVGFIFLATVFFFAFFGRLCADGDQSFCDKFTSEIMITGYCIISCLLLVGVTSFFRHRIPYEIFYIMHHFVFVIYILSTAHTFDNKQRSGEANRSQTFKWYSATILYYVCDRAAMYINNRFRTPMVSNSLVSGSKSSRMILLRLRRPALFNFQPGQYAFLKVRGIDHNHWHPFSIASGPQSDILEFYIEVFKDKSWTGKLWRMLENSSNSNNKTVWVEVMGPYGVPLADTTQFSHAIAIGAGTGIVPMLSMLKQHVRQVLRLDPATYFREMEEVQTRLNRLDRARGPRTGSVAGRLYNSCRGAKTNGVVKESMRREQLRSRLRKSFAQHQGDCLESRGEIMKAVNKATGSFYGVVFMIIMTIYGVSLIGFTYSWCTLQMDLYPGMAEVTAASTCLFFGLFMVISTGFWDSDHIINYIDIAISLISGLVCWYWFAKDLWANFSSLDLLNYTMLAGYMTFRFWIQSVKPRHQSSRQEAIKSGITTLERLDLVWVTRSASLVSEILPDINSIWENMVQAWGVDDAREVLNIRIFVTDADDKAIQVLRTQMAESSLYQSGNIRFERPDLGRIIEDHSLNMISQLDNSHTLLAFCGAPTLAREVHVVKINNDISTAITGNKYHQMEYVAESYGGYKRATAPATKEVFATKELHDDTGDTSEEESSFQEDVSSDFVPWRKTTHIGGQGFSDEDDFKYLLGIDFSGHNGIEVNPEFHI